MESGIASLYMEEQQTTPDGVESWELISRIPLRNADDETIGVLGIYEDITESKRQSVELDLYRHELERLVQERTRELKEAYDELESYSYAVAHDLRSPLRIINGFAQALQDDHPELGDASGLHLRRIMGASAKMGQLIDGLLQLSQYSRAEVQRHPEVVRAYLGTE